MGHRHRYEDLQPEATIQERFEAFHKAHPAVYTTLVWFARQAKKEGRKKIGIELLWSRLRWHVQMETNKLGDFAFDNDHRSRYARLIMAQEPDLAGIFDLRPLRRA